MKPFIGYIILAIGIFTGIAANSFAKISDGFTKLTPTILCLILMCITMFSLSKAMSVIPVGFAYSTYSGLTVTGVLVFAMIKYNQIPNLYAMIGITLIVIGVVTTVNTGMVDGFSERWFNSWMFAFPVALFAAFTMAPIMRPLVNKIASKE